MIDLGNWLSEAYRVPVAPHEDAQERDDHTLS